MKVTLILSLFFAALQRPLSQRPAGGATPGVSDPRLVPRAGQLPGGNMCRLRPGHTDGLLQVTEERGDRNIEMMHTHKLVQ